MRPDLGASLRLIKPDKRTSQLRQRPRGELTFATAVAARGQPAFVLDTNVYILDAGNNLPDAAQTLIDRGLLYHCTVCLAELAVGVANADPTRPNWADMRDHYSNLMARIPESRVISPDKQIWLDAGTIAGTLARTQNYQKHQRKECLNDALIYLTAAKAGLPVLTANRDEFDLIQQLATHGNFIAF